jgi:hypothetical protein
MSSTKGIVSGALAISWFFFCLGLGMGASQWALSYIPDAQEMSSQMRREHREESERLYVKAR